MNFTQDLVTLQCEAEKSDRNFMQQGYLSLRDSLIKLLCHKIIHW